MNLWFKKGKEGIIFLCSNEIANILQLDDNDLIDFEVKNGQLVIHKCNSNLKEKEIDNTKNNNGGAQK